MKRLEYSRYLFKEFVKKFDKRLIRYLLIALVIRLPFIFFRFDIVEFEVGQNLAELYSNNNILLYEAFRQVKTKNTIYPPLFVYILYILFFLIGGAQNYSYIHLKILWLIFDLMCVVYIYKLATLYYKSKKQQILFINMYILCPFVFLFTAYRGINDTATLFFILASIYYHISDRKIRSYVFMGLGFVYSFLPVFLIIPYFLYSLQRKKMFKNFLLSIPILFLITFLTYLPYLILIPDIIIQDFISMLTRTRYAITFPETINLPMFYQTLFKIDLMGFEIEILIFHIFILIILFIMLLIFLIKYKPISNRGLIGCIVIFFLLLPFLIHSFHNRLFLWIYPLLSLVLLDFEDLSNVHFDILKKQNKIQTFLTLIINSGIFIYSTIFYVENPNPEKIFPIYLFIIILLIYVFIWTIFILFQRTFYPLIIAIWLLIFTLYFTYYSLSLLFFNLIVDLTYLIMYIIFLILYTIIIFRKWEFY